MNESYAMPSMPEGAREGILKGMYKVPGARRQAQVRLLGAGTILNEVIAAAELLEKEHGVAAEVFSVTSFSELRRDGRILDPVPTPANRHPHRRRLRLCRRGRRLDPSLDRRSLRRSRHRRLRPQRHAREPAPLLRGRRRSIAQAALAAIGDTRAAR
jgi:pyruvate dehydrogenase E1 component